MEEIIEHTKEEFNEETVQALKECRDGENMVGPFDDIIELLESLKAED